MRLYGYKYCELAFLLFLIAPMAKATCPWFFGMGQQFTPSNATPWMGDQFTRIYNPERIHFVPPRGSLDPNWGSGFLEIPVGPWLNQNEFNFILQQAVAHYGWTPEVIDVNVSRWELEAMFGNVLAHKIRSHAQQLIKTKKGSAFPLENLKLDTVLNQMIPCVKI